MTRPLLVLVSGHPGSGKTTLGRALSDHMHLPHLNRDRIASGIWRTAHEDVDPRVAWDVFADTIARFAEGGVSLVADQTLYRGMEEEIRSRFSSITSLVNVHCRSPHAYERWRAKIAGGVSDGRPFDLAALEERVQRQRDEFTDPLDLGVPVIEVETSDGYDPSIERLVQLIGDSRS